ncbi:hypothetical protein GCM10028805_28020 [Spirosoma harenae]
MKTRLLVICLVWFSVLPGLAQLQKITNPPAPGFNLAGSDGQALLVADQVMAAVGGRAAWDDTQLIAWNVNGVRKLVWDKWSGNVRVDNLYDDQTILLNVNNGMGRVYRNGEELTEPDSVAKYVRQGRQHWLMDSYWLLLPFKLKDNGVTLKYLGTEPTQNGLPADVLQINLKQNNPVVDTRYKIWVDKKTRLVSQWAQYAKPTDKQPIFTLPWANYQQHGSILIASNRGDQKLTDIMIFTGLPGEVFSDFTRTDLSRYSEPK